jgi:glutamyl-tRNA reductase
MEVMALAIVNREPTSREIPPGSATWRTCLREVVFDDTLDYAPAAPRGDGKFLIEGEAYRTVLEILCGLQSPMLGETQVMGQFKAFLATLGRDQAWLNRLGQRLLGDARDVRTQHLQGLGSRSYGSAVRRYLADCGHAVLIGTGKLAEEVLPFLADDGRTVDQWGRTDLENANINTGPASSLPAALIIAAPVASEVVSRVAGRYPSLRCVIDLRADTGGGALDVSAPVVTLQDLFARMSAASGGATSRVDAARADIAARSRQYELRDELRPFGWDDLCA